MFGLTIKNHYDSSVGKSSACNAGDPGLILGLGRSPGEGNGKALHYSCLENPMDRGPWLATVHGIASFRHDLVTKPIFLSQIIICSINDYVKDSTLSTVDP